MTVDLKPCPFCGSLPENDNRTDVHSETERCTVSFGWFCRKCGVSKGSYSSQRKAINAWQTRYESQPELIPLDVDKLAQEIRRFNGNNKKGACEIAEYICSTFGQSKEKLVDKIEELAIEIAWHDFKCHAPREGDPENKYDSWSKYSELNKAAYMAEARIRATQPEEVTEYELEHLGLTALLNDQSVIAPNRKQLSIVVKAIHDRIKGGK